MTTLNDLSNRALAFFAFAAYHELATGEVVTTVASCDDAGHRLDPEAVAELVRLGLTEEGVGTISFTPPGQVLLAQIMDLLRGAR